ncbi:MAG TPA: hypothetical protein VF291_05675 [Burkholderiaceae bacterium]
MFAATGVAAVIGQAFAILAVVVCALLFARLLLGERRRRRVDETLIRTLTGTRRRLRSAWRWRRVRRAAAKEAAEAIRRARARRDEDEAGEWDGNVYKTKSFRGPRKPH